MPPVTAIALSVMQVLSSTSRELLIRIARETLEKFATTAETPAFHFEDAALLKRMACFVTLKKNGQLRGCIGTTKTDRPLFEQVIELTKAAAFHDPRFGPVRPEELIETQIEISILSPLEKIGAANQLEVVRHGIFFEARRTYGSVSPRGGSGDGMDSRRNDKKLCA